MSLRLALAGLSLLPLSLLSSSRGLLRGALLSALTGLLSRLAGLSRLITGHRLTVLCRGLSGLIGFLLSLRRLTQTLGRLGNFLADSARDWRLWRPIPFCRRLSLLSRLLQVLRSLLGRLSGLIGIPLLYLLLSRLHVLLTTLSLFARTPSTLGGLLLIERLLTKSLLRFGQLLTQLLRGVVQLLLTLLLSGVHGLRLLAELFHLLRGGLLPLGQLVRLLSKFRVRARVVLQLLGKLLR